MRPLAGRGAAPHKKNYKKEELQKEELQKEELQRMEP